MTQEKKKIAIGLSGGVDSSVAALLLKEAGYDVFALFMQNWHDTTGTLHGDCEWEEDLSVAKMVARKLDIPFHFIDLSGEYRQQVVNYMFDEYEKGRTPNPDVLCNSKIKFAAFLKHALELGADYVATGHYCQKEVVGNENKDNPMIGPFSEHLGQDPSENIYRIISGADPNKDQTYFLCQLTQEQLSRAIFPIGNILKPEVRRLAAQANLPTADKKDSQGICFVGKVDLPVFLQQKLATKEGNVVEIFPTFYEGSKEQYPGYDTAQDAPQRAELEYSEQELEALVREYRYQEGDGKIIGKHFGAQFFTIGQRKGLNIGGHKESIFVIQTNTDTNTIYVGEGHEHPGLLRKALYIKQEEIHWIREDLEMEDGEVRDYLVRIRYRQPLEKARLFKVLGKLYVVFNNYQRGITSGQFAVWYSEDDREMLGSGIIS